MRSLRALHTIPAHKSTVSDVKFFRRAAEGANSFQPSEKTPRKDVEMASTTAETEAETPSTESNRTTAGDVPAAPLTYFEDDNKFISGLYFASSGYDGFVKIWSADDWQLVKVLSTDAGKVMSVDVSPDGRCIASGTYNRSFQLFANENNPL